MDFNERLKEKISQLNLPIMTKLGINTKDESAAFYPIPGGQVTKVFMDGIKEQQLNYEYAIKSKRQEIASQQLWRVSNFLENLEELESNDESFEFGTIVITSKPASSNADEQGFFYWAIDFTVTLTTFRNKE
ncbi:MAG: minor capsid protein [Enterococcaceae bacterium]|jgi:hypothetical protein|nr:minor capsid protein [Enterococcaceae bacterium]